MKKMISMMLAMVMAFSLLPGCAKGGDDRTEPTTVATEAVVTGPASALELMQTVWDNYAEDQKFAVMGGGMENPVDGGPGSVPLDEEGISYSLLIPEEQLANVTEVVSMIHMMNANTFTSAAYKLAEGVSVEAFAAAMKDAIMNNQWMCGFPDRLLIESVPGGYVVVAFGKEDPMASFKTNLTAVYPDTTELVNEPIL